MNPRLRAKIRAMSLRRSTYLNRDGMRLAASVGGEPQQPAVILLHGGGQTRHSWAGTVRRLVALGYHVLSLDARGHGESDWSATGQYSLDALADDLIDVAAGLPTLPTLIGASMGGITAMYAIGRAAAAVARALVLVDVVPRNNPAGVARILAFMRSHPHGFATLENAAAAVAAYNPARREQTDVSGLMKNLRRRDDNRLYWHWDPRLVDRNNLGAPERYAERTLALCRNIRVPTLLVRGMQSDVVAADGIDELRQCVPQLELFDVEAAGHMIAGDRNDIFNDGILDFLARQHSAGHGPMAPPCSN